MSTELWPLNCRYICDARPRVEVDVLPDPEKSIKVPLECPWMQTQNLRRPVSITVSADSDGKLSTTCDEVPLCNDLHEYTD
ncbi:MAG TPA: hypothetical protein VMR19_01575 [Candidatus Saccharimonadales bacterium]|nr:hypothetical protein [Candidatus Saccharimonadales bacterium]